MYNISSHYQNCNYLYHYQQNKFIENFIPQRSKSDDASDGWIVRQCRVLQARSAGIRLRQGSAGTRHTCILFACHGEMQWSRTRRAQQGARLPARRRRPLFFMRQQCSENRKQRSISAKKTERKTQRKSDTTYELSVRFKSCCMGSRASRQPIFSKSTSK